jgi:hypothetical protein
MGHISVCRATSFLLVPRLVTLILAPAVTADLPGLALPFRRRRSAAGAKTYAT